MAGKPPARSFKLSPALVAAGVLVATLLCSALVAWHLDQQRLALTAGLGLTISLLLAFLSKLLLEARAQRGQLESLVAARTAEIQAREAELRIAAIAFEAQESIFITDAEERILRVNHAFTDNTGYTAAEAIGQTPRLIQSGHHDQAFFDDMWQRIHGDGFWQGEIWNRRKCGEIFPVWMTIRAVKDEQGEVTHFVATLTDISERKATEREIRQLAFYDALTNLPNRRLLLDRLRQAVAAAERTRQKGVLLFIDLDDFKILNDTLGHDLGDQLLQQVAGRLGACVREIDTVARLGGDEFVIMLQDLGPDPEPAAALARAVGQKVLTALEPSYRLGGHERHITPSIGIALFGHEPHAAADILRQADLAMYQAKAAGRNTMRFFDPAMEKALTERVQLEADLARALAVKQFVLHYQPQVDGQGRLAGAEVLLRWQHPRHGLLTPARFLELAETAGFGRELGRWVLSSACAQLVAWQAHPATARLTIAVNISRRHFRDHGFVEDVRAALNRSGADPARLRLELTEGPLLDQPADTLVKMTELKALGVGFTLDNFGVGYCSLAYLKRLPLDQLKMAPSFVNEVLSGCGDDRIAERFVALAESLGLGIMAEGVETEAQREYLARHGCCVFQGYLFGHPGPIEELMVSTGAAPDRPSALAHIQTEEKEPR